MGIGMRQRASIKATSQYYKLFLVLLLSLSSFIAHSMEEHAVHALNILEHQGKKYLAYSVKNEKDWHTYWDNPGDAGLPFRFEFSQNGFGQKISPAPKRYIEAGNIWAYGFSNLYTFFFELSKKNLQNVKFSAKFLICKEICIPGKYENQFDIKNGKLSLQKSNQIELSSSKLSSEFKKLPKTANWPAGLEVYLNKNEAEDNKLVLNYTFKGLSLEKLSKKHNLLTPFPTVPFTFKHEEVFWDKKNQTLYGKMKVDWDGLYQEPEIPMPKDGKFATPKTFKFIFYGAGNDPLIISKTLDSFAIKGQKTLDQFYSTLTSAASQPKANASNENNAKSSDDLLYFLIYAFIGGLILNLMPCVLPVISIKLFGLIKQRGEKSANLLVKNLSYTAGVLFTFVALALVVVSLKSAGESIGWGFQLQSPLFVTVMIGIIFTFSLNMFGLFEFQTPFGNKLGQAKIDDSLLGDFLAGVLTTILSTPCSAPFLGTALSFAFTAPTHVIILVFIAIGLGLATPFILTGLFPSLIKFLPKPGNWMNKLKYFLGFTLLLTCAWLLDVLFNIIDPQTSLVYIATFLALIFVSIFVYQKVWRNFLSLSLTLILPLGFFAFMSTQGVLKESEQQVKIVAKNWSSWNEKKMNELDKAVFVDFTAKWCLTCKVNKKLVLDTDDFSKFSKENNLELMRADWTKYDPTITNWLKKYNVVSVPAYFLKKKNGEVVFLGETISLEKVKKNL